MQFQLILEELLDDENIDIEIVEDLEEIFDEEITEEAAQDTTINFEGIFGPGFDVSLGEQDATPI